MLAGVKLCLFIQSSSLKLKLQLSFHFFHLCWFSLQINFVFCVFLISRCGLTSFQGHDDSTTTDWRGQREAEKHGAVGLNQWQDSQHQIFFFFPSRCTFLKTVPRQSKERAHQPVTVFVSGAASVLHNPALESQEDVKFLFSHLMWDFEEKSWNNVNY